MFKTTYCERRASWLYRLSCQKIGREKTWYYFSHYIIIIIKENNINDTQNVQNKRNLLASMNYITLSILNEPILNNIFLFNKYFHYLFKPESAAERSFMRNCLRNDQSRPTHAILMGGCRWVLSENTFHTEMYLLLFLSILCIWHLLHAMVSWFSVPDKGILGGISPYP